MTNVSGPFDRGLAGGGDGLDLHVSAARIARAAVRFGGIDGDVVRVAVGLEIERFLVVVRRAPVGPIDDEDRPVQVIPHASRDAPGCRRDSL